MSMDPPGIVEAHGPPVGIRRRGRQLGSHDAASPATSPATFTNVRHVGRIRRDHEVRIADPRADLGADNRDLDVAGRERQPARSGTRMSSPRCSSGSSMMHQPPGVTRVVVKWTADLRAQRRTGVRVAHGPAAGSCGARRQQPRCGSLRRRRKLPKPRSSTFSPRLHDAAEHGVDDEFGASLREAGDADHLLGRRLRQTADGPGSVCRHKGIRSATRVPPGDNPRASKPVYYWLQTREFSPWTRNHPSNLHPPHYNPCQVVRACGSRRRAR